MTTRVSWILKVLTNEVPGNRALIILIIFRYWLFIGPVIHYWKMIKWNNNPEAEFCAYCTSCFKHFCCQVFILLCFFLLLWILIFCFVVNSSFCSNFFLLVWVFIFILLLVLYFVTTFSFYWNFSLLFL